MKRQTALAKLIPTELECPVPAAVHERLAITELINANAYAGIEPANESSFVLNEALKESFLEFTKARCITIHGGRASSKSTEFASWCVMIAANYTVKIMCARQFQANINESVYPLLKARIEASPWRDDFVVLKTSIRNRITGSEFLFYGIEKNVDSIKSTEGVDILWLEEAHYLTVDQWKLIEPTIRRKGSKVCLVLNPGEITDFVYQTFIVNKPADGMVREINWESNVFLNTTALKVIFDNYSRDPTVALHVYGGVPGSGSSSAVIQLRFVLACVDAHLKMPEFDWTEGDTVTGFDPSDGGDSAATVTKTGRIISGIDEWRAAQGQMPKSCARAWNTAHAAGGRMLFDVCGLGAMVGNELERYGQEKGERLRVSPFNAGDKVVDPDEIASSFAGSFGSLEQTNQQAWLNAKAQAWAYIARCMRSTYYALKFGRRDVPVSQLISIDSAGIPKDLLERLKIELSVCRRAESAGKFKVESKDDLRRRGIKSPNVADACIMAVWGRSNMMKKDAGFFDAW